MKEIDPKLREVFNLMEKNARSQGYATDTDCLLHEIRTLLQVVIAIMAETA